MDFSTITFVMALVALVGAFQASRQLNRLTFQLKELDDAVRETEGDVSALQDELRELTDPGDDLSLGP